MFYIYGGRFGDTTSFHPDTGVHTMGRKKKPEAVVKANSAIWLRDYRARKAAKVLYLGWVCTPAVVAVPHRGDPLSPKRL